MKFTAIVGVEGQRLHAAVFAFAKLVHQGLHDHRGLLGVLDHEGQRHGFCDGETVGGVDRQGPRDVADTLTGLIRQLRGFATQLHRGEHLHVNCAVRRFFQLCRPRFKEFALHRCHGGQEVVQAQGNFSSVRARQQRGGGECGTHGCHHATAGKVRHSQGLPIVLWVE